MSKPRKEPACIGQCVAGDKVQLPDGRTIRVLRRQSGGGAYCRGYDMELGIEVGEHFNLDDVQLIKALEWRPTK